MPARSEQLSLEFDAAPRQPPREDRNSGPVRHPVPSMVNLALTRGYARDVEDLIDQVAALRQYRLFTSLLAVLQRPHATHLLSAHTWGKRWGRTISPGEQPIVLLAPTPPWCFSSTSHRPKPMTTPEPSRLGWLTHS
jgi:hypothetical protein